MTLVYGDCRDLLPTVPSGSVQACVTSPPYWAQRDYGTGGIGAERLPSEYVAQLVAVFREVRRTLRGWWEWGTNILAGWLTDAGRAALLAEVGVLDEPIAGDVFTYIVVDDPHKKTVATNNARFTLRFVTPDGTPVVNRAQRRNALRHMRRGTPGWSLEMV